MKHLASREEVFSLGDSKSEEEDGDAIAIEATWLVDSYSSSSSSDEYSSWATNTILEFALLLGNFLLKNGFLLGYLDLSLRTSLPSFFSLGS